MQEKNRISNTESQLNNAIYTAVSCNNKTFLSQLPQDVYIVIVHFFHLHKFFTMLIRYHLLSALTYYQAAMSKTVVVNVKYGYCKMYTTPGSQIRRTYIHHQRIYMTVTELNPLIYAYFFLNLSLTSELFLTFTHMCESESSTPLSSCIHIR